ncbi:Type IV pilus biogenesis protein PilN [hydrothermal vent metagenome]|uniref:Type IV pilus biogenesis protein PilN n=1 Tax=hydrothermal vent metagenome TaxID=652676 RepID=A0A3B1A8J1_9ZZZZ
MAKINLLPWRQELRKEQQRQFLTIMGLSVVLVVVGILAVHLQYARLIGKQEERNAFLTQHIRKVEAEIKEIDALADKKDRLLARMEIIQKLQRNRPEMVRLFDELVRVLPEGVHLSALKQTNRSLKLDGIAQSNARVSAFMRNIDDSDWLADPKLQIIEVGKDENTRKFSLRAKQASKGLSESSTDRKRNNAGRK